MSLVADDRVLLVADKGERTGAERHLVELVHLAFGLSLSAYSFDMIEAKGMARLARNGASLRFSLILTRHVVDFLDRLEQFRQAHAGEIFPGTAGYVAVPRMVRLPLRSIERSHRRRSVREWG